MKLTIRTPIPLPVERIKAGFNRELFLALLPASAELLRFDGCERGGEVHLKLSPLGPLWVSVITEEGTTPRGWSFVDEGRKLPFPLHRWHHHHRVDRVDESHSTIVDDISFDCDPKFLTSAVKPLLWASFRGRPGVYKKFFLGK